MSRLQPSVADGTGVIHVEVDADRMYDITGFLSCVDGWFLFGGGDIATCVGP